MPDFPSILPTTAPPTTRLGAYLGYQTDRLMAFVRRLTGLDTGEQVCYVFSVNADEVGLRLYDRLLQAYLNRFPHRFTNGRVDEVPELVLADRKSTRLNSSHLVISYAVFCLKKKT